MYRRIFLVTGFLIGFFIWQISIAQASDFDIIINEIGAYETTGYEWIEIWNKGSSPVDLTGWKFWENNTNHSLMTSTTDSILELGEYGVICQDDAKFLERYPGFVGSVFDSSWSSLNEGGEEIGLKSGDILVDDFVYPPALNYSLERLDAFAPATTSNWCEHVLGNTVGLPNSRASCEDVVPPITPTSTPTSTDEVSTESQSDYSFWFNIKLNEIVVSPDDSENEKIELYNNSTSTVILSGGYICDNHLIGSYCKPVNGVIVGRGFLVVDLGTRSLLNNDADSVILKNPDEDVIAEVIYEGDTAPKKGESFARSIDGAGSWQITTAVTMGASNNIVARVIVPPSINNGASYNPLSNQSQTTTVAPATTTILINEIYPDPTGADNDDEFIELYNFGSQAVDLGDWKIKDNEKSYTISANIPAGGYLVLKRPDTEIALNNTAAESVVLVDAWGRQADKISYERALTGESYNRTADGWRWSYALTPGLKNVIEEPDAISLIWKILAPDSGEPDEVLKFSAVGSVDPRGGQLNYLWKFASGTEFVGPTAEYKFTTSGIFEMVLNASSTAGTSGNKKLSIKIGTGLSVQNALVGITEILPNPDGNDDNEYIEVSNFGSSTVNLANWILRVDTKQYEIPIGTNIAPSSSLVFYRLATKMALNNSGGKVSLLTPALDTVDFVKYDKAISGKSYSLEKNIWQWSAPSPGVVFSPPAGGGAGGGGSVGVVKLASVAKSTASTAYFVPNSITDARVKPKDAKVKVRGVVSTLPGVFGTQYFYIEDGQNGLQVYQNKKDFPTLTLGDEIEVSGLTSEASGQKRIRASGASDIKVIKNGSAPMSLEMVIDELSEELLGRLVKVFGDITEMKSGYFYLDNEVGEIKVTLKTGAKIDKKLFNEGDSVEVSGILENGKGGMEIWPRGSDDIKVIGVAPEVKGVKITASSGWRSYAYMVLGVMGVVGLGWGLREREKVGGVLKKFFKM